MEPGVTCRAVTEATVASWLLLTLLFNATSTSAQDIEPRAFSNAPIGVNFLVGGYAWTSGALSFDPALPLRDAALRTSSAVVGYARVLDFWGRSAKFDAVLPFTALSGTALLAGQPVDRHVNGFGDARLRLSVNWFGAPALTFDEFASYRQDLIIGTSLQISIPTGQYDPSRAINLGMNRWFVKPELGLSKTLGPLTLEGMAALTLFTDNTNFLDGKTRAQNPILSLQAHAIYHLRSGIWTSVDLIYFTGGRTSIDGTASDDLQRNWRIGATVSVPIDRHYSLRFYASHGVSARTRNNFDLVGIALQYRWGGGL